MQAVSTLIPSSLSEARSYTDMTCPAHGVYQAYQLPIVKDRWSNCPACTKEREAQEEAEKAQAALLAKQASTLQAFGRAGIPDRFLDRTLKSFVAATPAQQAALQFACKYAREFEVVRKTGRSAIFSGRPGTGKTHLACGIAKQAIARYGATVLFITVMRAMRSIKDTWVKGSAVSESQAIEALVAPDLLILDEVGVQFGSDFEKNTLFDVLNERYECCKPTIFLSNLTKDEIAEFLGERVMDRLKEDGGEVVPFAWESYRGKSGGAQ